MVNTVDFRYLGSDPHPDAGLLTVPAHLTLDVNRRGRDFFVGDLHGQATMLMRLLKQVSFQSGRDRLICVGDFLDRGPDGARLLRLFAKGFMYSTLGNHEARYIAGDGRPYDHDPYYRRDASLPGADHETFVAVARRMPLTIEVPLADGRRIGVVHAEVPGADWSVARRAVPLYRHVRWIHRDEDAAIGLHSRELAHHLRSECRPVQPAMIANVDLVITGHSNLCLGHVWRYGNQIGLESLAFHREGAMTLYEPLHDRYWAVCNAQRNPGLDVLPVTPPVDLSTIAWLLSWRATRRMIMSKKRMESGNIYTHEGENVALLCARFPRQFPKSSEFDRSAYSLPDGWMALVTEICERVDDESIDVAWNQIKEKYGHLRMYYAGMSPRVDVVLEDGSVLTTRGEPRDAHSEFDEWLRECERRSGETCCRCGEPGAQAMFGNWQLPICRQCEPIVRAFRTVKSTPSGHEGV